MAETALVFNALSGPELVEAIVADIRKKLVATGDFDANITFPWVKYEFRVSMVSYPKQPADADPVLVAHGTGGATEGVPSDATPDLLKETVVADSVVVDTPDHARIDSGLPIPTPAPGPGKVLVDKLVQPAPQKSDTRPFGYKGTDGKGKSSGTGNQSSS